AYEDKKNLTAEEKQVCQKIEQIIAETIHEGMTREEKAKAIHDYIINLNAYDYENYNRGTLPDTAFDVRGVLLRNKSVCQGYAETYFIFMHLLDIPCKMISGGDHGWNLVKLSDGKWYHVDCTWDDPVMEGGEQKLLYRYLFMNDEIMLLDHQWEVKDFPACNGTKYLYYGYDTKLASVNDFADAVRKAYAEGKHELTVLYPEEGLPDLQIICDITGANRVGYYPPEKLGKYTIFTVTW
ncbi:MAG: transglutaminase domain-containing protein, partial [Acetivibrio ethanolgignens]